MVRNPESGVIRDTGQILCPEHRGLFLPEPGALGREDVKVHADMGQTQESVNSALAGLAGEKMMR